MALIIRKHVSNSLMIGGLRMEDSVKNYKNLQSSLFHNVVRLVDVNEIGVHLPWFIPN
jgi:hypothetical protein